MAPPSTSNKDPEGTEPPDLHTKWERVINVKPAKVLGRTITPRPSRVPTT